MSYMQLRLIGKYIPVPTFNVSTKGNGVKKKVVGVLLPLMLTSDSNCCKLYL